MPRQPVIAPERPVVEPDDPYPPTSDFRIRDFRYVDHLQLVRYNARPKGSAPGSDWQLAESYTVEIDIDYDRSGELRRETWRITAPRGLYTDLSSIPAFGRWIVSKVGPHLEASIVHDYLYMKWTDARLGERRFCDWVFADEVLRAGMRGLADMTRFERFVVNFAVGTAGWLFFWRKKERLSEQLARWQPHLGYLPHTPVPPGEQAPPEGASAVTALYQTLVFLIFAAIALMGLDRLFGWIAWDAWQAAIAVPLALATWFFTGMAALVGVPLVLGLVFYFLLRRYIGWRRRA